jgi:hypothetical protein
VVFLCPAKEGEHGVRLEGTGTGTGTGTRSRTRTELTSVFSFQTADRLGMRMSELVEHVSKKPIPPWTKNLLVEVMVNDEDDEDVEVSQSRLWGVMGVSRCRDLFQPRLRRRKHIHRDDDCHSRLRYGIHSC